MNNLSDEEFKNFVKSINNKLEAIGQNPLENQEQLQTLIEETFIPPPPPLLGPPPPPLLGPPIPKESKPLKIPASKKKIESIEKKKTFDPSEITSFQFKKDPRKECIKEISKKGKISLKEAEKILNELNLFIDGNCYIDQYIPEIKEGKKSIHEQLITELKKRPLVEV